MIRPASFVMMLWGMLPRKEYTMDKKTVFSHIDHTILKPDATWAMVDRVCQEAVDNGFASACIPPRFVKQAKDKYGNRLWWASPWATTPPG